MLKRIFKIKGKKKSSSTSVPTTAAGLETQTVTDAHRPSNLAMDHEHDQSSNEEGSESTSLEYFPTAEDNQKGSINTLKNMTDLPVLEANDDDRMGLSSTKAKGESAKNPLEQNDASTDKDKIAVGVTGSDDPVKSIQGASSKANVLQNAHNFNINNSQFNAAGRDVRVHVTNNYNESLLTQLAYADGAGIDMTKACLQGTRTEILAEFKHWVTNTDATTPRILWFSGPAGTGKSAIAHSIARWWKEENKGIGSCFCFNRQATTRYEQLFTTIARDLAARIPGLKDFLINLITSEPTLGATADVTQQWRRLLQEPLANLAGGIAEPIVIVIDALDESGEPVSRSHILSILAKEAVKLPSNFRILVTSRPLPDIGKAFNNASGVRLESMDKLPPSSTKSDIQLYISQRLEGVNGFGNREFTQLARKSDSLFEWARLACEHIRYAQGLLTERERFEELIHAGEGKELLDTTYRIILRGILGDRPRDSTINRFRSVLRIVLSTLKPLPIGSLTVLHSAAQQGHNYDDVVTVLSQLGSLLSGISNQSMPVRPLHSTFHEFLTTRDRSGLFFVDVQDVNMDLAHACLWVMQQHLCFNICKLESSYVHNSEIADLGERIKDCIKPYLAYSCQFWVDHIRPLGFHAGLADGIKGILLNEKMLFWLEVLALLKQMSMVPTMLSIVASWLQDKGRHADVSAAARDGVKFARLIGGVITESTPHLYLSGLVFLPENSILSRHLKTKFPRIARIVFDRTPGWPSLQMSMRGHIANVRSVAFSPDGKRIASGSVDQKIHIWDAETGMQMGNPLEGHTDSINSVTFSPDGKRIASGSDGKTICIWDTENGKQVGKPLKVHTHRVNSVAFSPDRKRIASGSNDKTICIWDTENGKQVGKPLKGHTDWVNSVAFSPDGKRIASGSADKTICIWDTETGEQVDKPLKGHTSWVNSVAFSPDRKRSASGSADKNLYVWDADIMNPSPVAHTASGDVVHIPITRANVIRFSHAEMHELFDPLALFCGTWERQQNWREHVLLDSHGWITGPQGHLLMWVPEAKSVTV